LVPKKSENSESSFNFIAIRIAPAFDSVSNIKAKREAWD